MKTVAAGRGPKTGGEGVYLLNFQPFPPLTLTPLSAMLACLPGSFFPGPLFDNRSVGEFEECGPAINGRGSDAGREGLLRKKT